MNENKYSLTFGRKFLGMILGITVLTGSLIFISLLIPNAINASVVIIFFFLITFLVTAYIGGNVFSHFVQNKYFNFDKYNDQKK